MRHGTEYAYDKRRCRDAACRAAKADGHARRAAARRLVPCPRCGGPGGLYRDALCGACYEYRRVHGVDRPDHLIHPPPRHCETCGRQLDKGEPRRRGECEACSRYRYRYGRPRPAELYSRGGRGR